jgi:polyisoprenoid-binding protein YceI
VWETDREHSQVMFRIRHLGVTTVTGRFDRFAAEVAIDSANPTASRVEARIEVASLNTAVPARDATVRGPDWFDAARFPAVTFRSRAVRPLGGRRYEVVGDLTMRGVTRPVTLRATHNGTVARGFDGRPHAGFNAAGTLDRPRSGSAPCARSPGARSSSRARWSSSWSSTSCRRGWRRRSARRHRGRVPDQPDPIPRSHLMAQLPAPTPNLAAPDAPAPDGAVTRRAFLARAAGATLAVAASATGAAAAGVRPAGVRPARVPLMTGLGLASATVTGATWAR